MQPMLTTRSMQHPEDRGRQKVLDRAKTIQYRAPVVAR
jgi:hypothetical protein